MVHKFRAAINFCATKKVSRTNTRMQMRTTIARFIYQAIHPEKSAIMRRLAARGFGNNRVPTILHIGGRGNAINLKLRSARQH